MSAGAGRSLAAPLAGSAAPTRPRSSTPCWDDSSPTGERERQLRRLRGHGGQRPLRVARLERAGWQDGTERVDDGLDGRRGGRDPVPGYRRGVRDQLHRQPEPGARRLPPLRRRHVRASRRCRPLLALDDRGVLDLAGHGPESLHGAVEPPHREPGAGGDHHHARPRDLLRVRRRAVPGPGPRSPAHRRRLRAQHQVGLHRPASRPLSRRRCPAAAGREMPGPAAVRPRRWPTRSAPIHGTLRAGRSSSFPTEPVRASGTHRWPPSCDLAAGGSTAGRRRAPGSRCASAGGSP